MTAPDFSPDRRRFSRLARRYNLVPVVAEILGDEETPVSAFRKLRTAGFPSFLLESVEGGETWGRYSILGGRAAGRFTARGEKIELRWRGRRRLFRHQDPLAALATWLKRFRPAPVDDLPRFFGGAVGSIAYDAIRFMERVPDRHAARGRDPDIDLLLVSDLIVFDNLSHTLKVVACAFVGKDPPGAYQDACARIEAMLARLRDKEPSRDRVRAWSRTPRLQSDTDRRAFLSGVDRAREYIRAGDVFQVVLSHELSCPLRAQPFDVYRALRCINPSPYMFFLDYGERQVLGASPEVLVRVEAGRAVVRPIAGTRPRGRDAEEDAARTRELLADEKERAEHVMLVDLGRNDLGRVCRFGTVRTDEFMTVERYSHVIHIVSQVSGKLEQRRSSFDALRACFPAGTVSGAPKIRAMEIIDELEQRRRGVYAGAVGYFSYDGAMDTCIAIRTIVCEGDEARLGVGAGIVLDSRPERELAETLEKADAARVAIEMAERGLVL